MNANATGSVSSRTESLGNPYFRVFEWKGSYYAIAMPGVFYRSNDGIGNFEEGPTVFSRNMRHSAVRLVGDALRSRWRSGS